MKTYAMIVVALAIIWSAACIACGQTTQPVDPTAAVNAIQQLAQNANNAVAAAQAQTAQLQQQLTAAQSTIADLQKQVSAVPPAQRVLTSPISPAWPTVPIYQPDKTYHVAPAGSDATGDGSAARPYATVGKALGRIAADRAANGGPPALAEIAFLANGSVYTTPISLNLGGVLIDSYGSTGPLDKATFQVTPTAYAPHVSGVVALNKNTIYLQNLRFTGNPANINIGSTTQPSIALTAPDYGVYLNGCDDVSICDCEFTAFGTQNVCVEGCTELKVYFNYFARSWQPNHARSQGLYTQNVVGMDVEANVFYHNGWSEADTPANPDPATVAALWQNHGWYDSAANNGSPAAQITDRFNIYIDNAATGHQGRNGGAQLYNVYQSNGEAKDTYTQGANGEIGFFACFGPTQPGPFAGGGILGESLSQNIHDGIFFGTNQTLDTAVTVDGTFSSGSPSSTTSNLSGIWPNAAISYGNGRTGTSSGVRTRAARAGEHVPSLLDYFGTQNDDATAEYLRTHAHDPRCSAQAVIAWAKAQVTP